MVSARTHSQRCVHMHPLALHTRLYLCMHQQHGTSTNYFLCTYSRLSAVHHSAFLARRLPLHITVALVSIDAQTTRWLVDLFFKLFTKNRILPLLGDWNP